MWMRIKQVAYYSMVCSLLWIDNIFVPTAFATPLDDLFLLDTPAITKPSVTTPIPVASSSSAYVATLASPVFQWETGTLQSSSRGITGLQPAAIPIATEDTLLQITRTPELLNALRRMNDVPIAKTSLLQLQQRGGRVLFKNLAELAPQYSTFDALAWLGKDVSTPTGVTWILFIAEKHRKAPPEALASLITHEALHADYHNSYCEEEHAWLAEVTAWKAFKALNPALHHIPTGWFALVDRLNTIDDALAQQTLKTMIRNNPGYVGLAENSPYFRYSPFGLALPIVGKSTQSVVLTPPPVSGSSGEASFNNIRAAGKQVVTTYPALTVASNGRPRLVLRPLKTWYH
jgi:hypothetical protein